MSVKLEIRDTANSLQGTLILNEHEDFPLTLNEKLSDLRNLTARSGSHSKQFVIPATKENNDLLEYIYNVNSKDIKDVKNEKPCRVIVNGIHFENYTKIRITDVRISNGIPIEYEAIVFGDNIDWVDSFKDTKINEFDYGRPIVMTDNQQEFSGSNDLANGRATSTSANKLVDTAEDFLTNGVEVDMILYDITGDSFTTVAAIDSSTQISVNNDIFAALDFWEVFPWKSKTSQAWKIKVNKAEHQTGNTSHLWREYTTVANDYYTIEIIDADITAGSLKIDWEGELVGTISATTTGTFIRVKAQDTSSTIRFRPTSDYDGAIQVYIHSQVNTLAWNDTNVSDSWDGTYEGGWDYVCPLINYGEWQGFSAAAVEDFRPALYIKGILDKAFDSVNYKLESTFWDDSDNEKLIMPYTGDGFTLDRSNQLFQSGVSADTTAALTASGTDYITIPLNDDSTGDNFDTGSLYNTSTYKWRGSIRNLTAFEVSVSLVLEAGASPHNWIQVYKDSVSTANLLYEKKVTSNTETVTFQTDFYNLNSLNDVFLVFKSLRVGQVGRVKFTLANTHFRNEIDERILEGNNVIIKDTLNDYTVLDIINGLSSKFNLYWKTDPKRKIVYCETRDSFYTANSTAKDWSKKLDVSQPIEIKYVSDYEKDLKFRYAEDAGDAYVNRRNQAFDLDYAGYNHTLPTRFNKGERIIGNDFFAPTYSMKDQSIAAEGSEGNNIFPFIPRLWGEYTASPPEYKTDYEPRILYYQGNVSHNSSQWWYRSSTGGARTKQTTIPLSYMADTVEGNGINLFFNNDATAGAGLFDTYYNQTIRTLEDGNIIEAYFRLTEIDLHNIDLRTPIYLDFAEVKGYYIIEEIEDYSPFDQNSVKVRLIKISALTNKTVTNETTESEGFFNQVWPSVSANSGRNDMGASFSTKGGSSPLNPYFALNNGTGNQAQGGSIAFGHGLISSGLQQTVLGKYNTVDENAVFIIGGGTSEDDRKNILTVNEDGSIDLYGGELYTKDTNGNYINVFRNDDGILKKLYIDG